MGEAKRRRDRQTALLAQDSLTPERVLLRRAAIHLDREFVRALGLVGACRYVSFALHHYLADRHGLIVPVQIGWVRSEDLAWSSHAWLELDGRKTDLALRFPNPPVPAGDLVIDGEVIEHGTAKFLYSLEPNDGVPKNTEADGDAAARDRRTKEHALFHKLGSGNLGDVEKYLAGDPSGLHLKLLRVWSRFSA